MNANGKRETQIHAFVLTVFRQVPVAADHDGTESDATTEPYGPAAGTRPRSVKVNYLSSAELYTRQLQK
jgi:hypothetical protein